MVADFFYLSHIKKGHFSLFHKNSMWEKIEFDADFNTIQKIAKCNPKKQGHIDFLKSFLIPIIHAFGL